MAHRHKVHEAHKKAGGSVHQHHHYKKGGAIRSGPRSKTPKPEADYGKREVMHEGAMADSHPDAFAAAARKEGGAVPGKKHGGRLDKHRRRATGGKVSSPFSAAGIQASKGK